MKQNFIKGQNIIMASGNMEKGEQDGRFDQVARLTDAAYHLAKFSYMLFDGANDILMAYACKSSILSRAKMLSKRAVDAINQSSDNIYNYLKKEGDAEGLKRMKLEGDLFFFPVCRALGIENEVRKEWHQPSEGKALNHEDLGEKKRISTGTHTKVLEKIDAIAAKEKISRQTLIEEILISYVNHYYRDTMK